MREPTAARRPAARRRLTRPNLGAGVADENNPTRFATRADACNFVGLTFLHVTHLTPQLSVYKVSPIGKTGLPVSASWMSMPVMPIIAARPLLRSALSFHVLPRKSSSSPTYGAVAGGAGSESRVTHTWRRQGWAGRPDRALSVGLHGRCTIFARFEVHLQPQGEDDVER